MSVSYKNKIRLIEGGCINQNLKQDLIVKGFFKKGLFLTITVLGLLYLSQNINLV